MSLTYSLVTANDLLEKLKREMVRLEQEVTGDTFFNFLVTAYHITDWIEKDDSIHMSKEDIDSMYQDRYIAISKDLANASKHFSLNYDPVTDSAESQQGFGCGRWGKGGWGVGEEQIIIKCTDGSVCNALDFARDVLNSWELFFNGHGI